MHISLSVVQTLVAQRTIRASLSVPPTPRCRTWRHLAVDRNQCGSHGRYFASGLRPHRARTSGCVPDQRRRHLVSRPRPGERAGWGGDLTCIDVSPTAWYYAVHVPASGDLSGEILPFPQPNGALQRSARAGGYAAGAGGAVAASAPRAIEKGRGSVPGLLNIEPRIPSEVVGKVSFEQDWRRRWI